MTASDTTLREVLIYEDGQGPPRFHPASLPVDKGDGVVWRNTTDCPALVFFPPRTARIFEGEPRHLDVPGGKESRTLTVKTDADQGAYPYSGSLDCERRPSVFIVGNSNPVMIVRE